MAPRLETTLPQVNTTLSRRVGGLGSGPDRQCAALGSPDPDISYPLQPSAREVSEFIPRRLLSPSVVVDALPEIEVKRRRERQANKGSGRKDKPPVANIVLLSINPRPNPKRRNGNQYVRRKRGCGAVGEQAIYKQTYIASVFRKITCKNRLTIALRTSITRHKHIRIRKIFKKFLPIPRCRFEKN